MRYSDSIVVTESKLIPANQQTKIQNVSVPLFVDCWQGKPGVDCVMLIIHGLGEHSGRYRHLATLFHDEFERFYAMDTRGHGRSGGLRGDTPTFDQFILDIKQVVQSLHQREAGKRLVLLAHSFGGLLALQMLLQEKKVPFVAAVISSPLLGVKLQVPRWKILLSQILAHTFPTIQLDNEVNPNCLSHDPVVVEAYTQDRLVHHKITPRLYSGLTQTMQWVRSHTGPLACPTVFLLPGQDQIVDSMVTKQFFQQLKYRYKEIFEYSQMYHEVFNEIEKENVVEDVKKWLKTVLKN